MHSSSSDGWRARQICATPASFVALWPLLATVAGKSSAPAAKLLPLGLAMTVEEDEGPRTSGRRSDRHQPPVSAVSSMHVRSRHAAILDPTRAMVDVPGYCRSISFPFLSKRFQLFASFFSTRAIRETAPLKVWCEEEAEAGIGAGIGRGVSHSARKGAWGVLLDLNQSSNGCFLRSRRWDFLHLIGLYFCSSEELVPGVLCTKKLAGGEGTQERTHCGVLNLCPDWIDRYTYTSHTRSCVAVTSPQPCTFSGSAEKKRGKKRGQRCITQLPILPGN